MSKENQFKEERTKKIKRLKEIREKILTTKNTITIGDDHTVGLRSDGTVVAVGKNDDEQCNISGWKMLNK